MNNEYFLTIAVITMNRSNQLEEAINSCLSCNIPADTQFVIVNNASTDNTEECVNNLIRNNPKYHFDYFLSPINVGAGGGRNKALELSKGKYVYFLDDDAIIDPKYSKTFFPKCLDIMERNVDIASLSTNIYDTICGNERNPKGLFAKDELRDILAWRGGSHFLRRSVFMSPLYLNIRYGSEELAPSIKAWDKGYRNVYYDEVRIIHQPRNNKWAKGTNHLIELSKLHTAMHYATYTLLYPKLFYPIIHLVFSARCKKHLSPVSKAKDECEKLVNEIIKTHQIDKISTKTVFLLWRKFKWTAF